MQPGQPSPIDLPSPGTARIRFERLEAQRQAILRLRQEKAARLAALAEYLGLAPAVDEALDRLSEELFGRLAKIIEQNLTLALQEVLAQPIQLKVEREFKRGTATMSFRIERDGQPEDIMKGQGGSVANILSVGLRIFALAQLDKQKHRRFLVLDEQDCWLAPDLVPRLMKIVHHAARSLGFQVVVISHHDIASFEPYADRIYRFVPNSDGVTVKAVYESPQSPD